jgi:hypothetical protein
VRCSVEAMRHAASITALLLVLLAPSAARAGDAPKLRATVSSCQTGIDPASRSAAFTASMPANADTARMAIRFDLQQRTVDGGVWRKVAAPSFGRWERSRAGVAGFVYAKDVHGLTAPGEYRAVVRFRWYTSDGTVSETRRITRSCKQPDQRPDLVGGRVQVVPAADGTATYRVAVRNTGRTAAGPFAVALTVGGTPASRTTVGGLAPGGATTVDLAGPACSPGLQVQLAIDDGNAVDESSEAGSVVGPVCPSSRD